MKRFIFLTGILLATAACVGNENGGTDIPSPGTVAFIVSDISTRASSAPTSETVSLPGNGGFHLEMTTDTMSPVLSPETKATPAYTSNAGELYGSFTTKIYNPSGGALLWNDIDFGYDSSTGRWQRYFADDPWAQYDPLYLAMLMPEDAEGLSGFACTFPSNQPTITFSYDCPQEAEDQSDVLISGRPLGKSEYEGYRTAAGGAPVLFHHALTAIKFAIGNNDADLDARAGKVETYISSIVISGLKGSGTCTIRPDNEGDYTDHKTDYSSSTAVTWVTGNTTKDFYQEFNEADITDFISGEFADSFYQAGNLRNLNDEDASYTFWLIPQDVTSALKLTVTFHVWDGTASHGDHVLELNLGELLLAQTSGKNIRWLPGEMRTFTLKPDGVDVLSSDSVSGNVKSNYTVKNTGNVDQYVRCMIVGNWVNAAGDVVAAYTSATNDTFLQPWTEGNTAYGTFTNLGLAARHWDKNDRYYYYALALEPGESIPAEEALFTTYTAATAPAVWTVDPENPTQRVQTTVHLKMQIVVQAIEAPANSTYKTAWTQAAGVTWNE